MIQFNDIKILLLLFATMMLSGCFEETTEVTLDGYDGLIQFDTVIKSVNDVADQAVTQIVPQIIDAAKSSGWTILAKPKLSKSAKGRVVYSFWMRGNLKSVGEKIGYESCFYRLLSRDANSVLVAFSRCKGEASNVRYLSFDYFGPSPIKIYERANGKYLQKGSLTLRQKIRIGNDPLVIKIPTDYSPTETHEDDCGEEC